ncbi:GNAT family N-acetyltransferase [uncultured Pontibacter sp.]|uniref:GNAT family N-acetyltransferase n=1 Tax=uncultured Pontibacter sp. TaxID=453356 RepID=UPI00260B7AB6|nr:GNAT family N-acetyltransferase [uncultured Pontibacter sp.]
MATKSLEILVGVQVFKALEDVRFQDEWDRLYERCRWSTVFQGRAFTSTWYKIHSERQEPVLVRAVQGGRLTGLLLLSSIKGSALLVGAGNADAEYQTWLSDDDSDEFMPNALSLVIDSFPYHRITIMYIPGNVPLNWVVTTARWRSRCIVHTVRRPIIDLSKSNVKALFAKKEFRKKVNKLKGRGEVSFEHITDYQRFSDILDILVVQHDFRKGAKYNALEFKSDLLKKHFFLALFKQGVLHATVLKLDEEIVASVVGTRGKKWFLLVGINTHAPAYADYSTGYILFIMLAEFLVNTGFVFFDLTPGGESYKERLANMHTYAYKLVITTPLQASVLNKVINPVQNLAKASFVRNGYKLREIKMRFYRLREQFLAASAAGPKVWVTGIWGKISGGCYFLLPPSGSVGAASGLRRGSLSDLLDFGQGGGLLTRWDFLAQAERRLQAGQEPLTLSREGLLLCCVWLLPGGELEGLYCHRGREGELAGFLAAVAEHAGEGARVLVREPSLRRALERAGVCGINV